MSSYTNNQPRAEVAYQEMLSAIQNGTLTPGTRIREVELAEQFGISRTPIRDAIRRLENDGLVVHVPRHGAVIKKLEYREVVELYEIREVLESTAARYAAIRASGIEVSELIKLNDSMLAHADDHIKVAEQNRLFHRLLYQIANNRYLIKALDSLSNSMALLGGTTLQSDNRTAVAHKEHSNLLKAIKARIPDEAEHHARLHIQNALRIRIQSFRETN